MGLGRFIQGESVPLSLSVTDPATGGEIDADALPTYRVYLNGSLLDNGTLAKLDDANTLGLYEHLLVTDGTFTNGGAYTVQLRAVVGGVAGHKTVTFQMGPGASNPTEWQGDDMGSTGMTEDDGSGNQRWTNKALEKAGQSLVTLGA